MSKEPSTGSMAGAGVAMPAEDTSFFGHPRGLSTLFFTELWERFSYYGMRALLILFMTAPVAAGGLGFDTAKAGAVYGLYTALVYLLALPGGWFADKIVGPRNAVLYGGIIISLGHFSMAFPSVPMFYLGLALIILGTGLLKPNVSTMVGDLYPEGGARRDAGFSIFYMGINLGAFFAPLIVGFLGQQISWHLGFGAAGVGMVIGVIWYLAGAKHLGETGVYREEAPGSRAREIRRLWMMLGAGVVLVGAIAFMNSAGIVTLTAERMAGLGGIFISGLAILYFLYMLTRGGLDATEKKRLGVIFVLFLFSAMFWSGFEQAGSSLNLVADRLTNRVVMGWEFPASWFQSVNAFFIISLAPVFAWLWVALGKHEPSSPAKFALGLILLGLGFLVLAWATVGAAAGQQISPAWLIVTYFLHTTGELCLSPVGLSTVTKLAPQRMVGQMMGVWFMSISLGNLIGGQVAGLFDQASVPLIFGAVFATTAGSGIVLLLFARPIRRMMGGVH